MHYSRIDRSQWKEFFNILSQRTQTQEIELRIAAEDIGDQTEEGWTRSDGFSYDPKTDVLYVHANDLAHPISEPQYIVLGAQGAEVKSITVQDHSQRLHVIYFREPFLLNPAIAEEERRY
jgi:hypothetical protein